MFEEKNIKKQRNRITIFKQSHVQINPHQMEISESLVKEDGGKYAPKKEIGSIGNVLLVVVD